MRRTRWAAGSQSQKPTTGFTQASAFILTMPPKWKNAITLSWRTFRNIRVFSQSGKPGSITITTTLHVTFSAKYFAGSFGWPKAQPSRHRSHARCRRRHGEDPERRSALARRPSLFYVGREAGPLRLEHWASRLLLGYRHVSQGPAAGRTHAAASRGSHSD